MNNKSIFETAKAVHDQTKNKGVKRIMKNVMKRVTAIDFRGEQFPHMCSCDCGERICGKAIVLLGTGLIFVDEDHLVRFVGTRTADVIIREVEPCTVN